MKRFYISLLLLSLTSIGFSQTYTPFLAEGKIWVVDYLYEPDGWSCNVPDGGGECYTEYYKLAGDTIINSTSYQILWLKQRNNSMQAQNNSYGDFIRHAYLREDLVEQRVYMHRLSSLFDTYCDQTDFSNAEEVKIYDFSLNINESIDRCAGSYVIGNKYYQDVLNGDTLVKFNDDFQECFGGFQGPTRYFFIVARESAYLQCVYLNGEAIYGSCSAELLKIDSQKNKSEQLIIYPSLVEDFISVVSPITQQLYLYNMFGDMVYSQKLVKGKNTINLAYLDPQPYILKAGNTTKKIVKL
jgi:hypothetical protein